MWHPDEFDHCLRHFLGHLPKRMEKCAQESVSADVDWLSYPCVGVISDRNKHKRTINQELKINKI
jgi:hypothetical protein